MFFTSTTAWGILEKLVTGPLFRRLSQWKHILDLNVMLEELLILIERNAKYLSIKIAE